MPCGYELVSSKNLDAVRYIGITDEDTPSARFKKHLSCARSGRKFPIYDWIRRHHVDGWIVTSNHVATFETYAEAHAWEEVRIAQRRAEGHDLMNCTIGGGGTPGHVHTAKSKESIGAGSTKAWALRYALGTEKSSAETCEKISIGQLKRRARERAEKEAREQAA